MYKRGKILEAPVIIWDAKYEDKPAEFLTFIQQTSDYMLLNGAGLFDDENPNHQDLFNVAKGKIDPKDYIAAEYAYGYKGNTPIRDNHFFYPAKSHTLGEIVKQPFRFSCKNISNEYTTRKLEENKAVAKKLIRTLFAQMMMQEDGTNVSFLEDADLNLNGTKDEVLDRLFGQEQLELLMYKIIQGISYEHNILGLARKCFDNKFDVNAEFAFIDVVNGQVIPSHVHPSQVRWIASKPVETFEDPAVTACSLVNYLTFTELINKYGDKLDTGTGPAGLLDAIDKLKEGAHFSYDPTRPYFSEYYLSSTWTSQPERDGLGGGSVFGRADYMKGMFYPYRKAPYGLGHSLLEHRMFFKVFVPKRYLVEINGKFTNEKEFKRWQQADYDRSLIADFKELSKEEKAPKGGYVVSKYKQELWEATRLGHGTLINVGRYEYASLKKGKEAYVGMPIVAQISREKSMVLVGENIARWTNILFNRVEDLLNQAGLSTAIMIDESVLGAAQAKGMLYNAKKAGLVMFNSSRMVGGNSFTAQHLGILKMGNHIEEINNMMAMIGLLSEIYNRMVGVSEQVQGISQPYDGVRQQQQNIANQSQLKVEKFYEHNLFMNQVLQRTADVAKYVYAREGYMTVTLSTGERQILKLMKELRFGDYDIFLESGAMLKDKKLIIDNAVISVLSSGGIEMLEPLIDILYTESPAEAKAIFRQAKEVIIKGQQAASQAQMQHAQAEAQIQAQKAASPAEVARINAQKEFALQEMKSREQRQREDFKGTLTDIKENNDRDKRLVDHDLEMDLATHQRALNTPIEELIPA
ncbi:hypothetical protein [Dyadobacter sp. BHUBP1]|uniref:hypothetical protein n=1 Tax=Dyadobacter sp. BHUBP1 TaxID=3424178 RepID=UPI003D32AF96